MIRWIILAKGQDAGELPEAKRKTLNRIPLSQGWSFSTEARLVDIMVLFSLALKKKKLAVTLAELWRAKVGYTGFEPVTSALSRQRSKPTELISLEGVYSFERTTKLAISNLIVLTKTQKKKVEILLF